MQKPTPTPRRTNAMQVKMFRADKMEDLEAKVNAWLNEHGAKIDIEHTQTISGSETRDGANQSAYYAISIWYYDIAKG
jgi:hypothetical protein